MSARLIQTHPHSLRFWFWTLILRSGKHTQNQITRLVSSKTNLCLLAIHIVTAKQKHTNTRLLHIIPTDSSPEKCASFSQIRTFFPLSLPFSLSFTLFTNCWSVCCLCVAYLPHSEAYYGTLIDCERASIGVKPVSRQSKPLLSSNSNSQHHLHHHHHHSHT